MTRAIILALCLASAAHADTLRVIDGDTIRWGSETFRVEGIDTPETHRPQCEAERRRGEMATRLVRQLIQSAREVRIIRTGIGKYGRTIARFQLDGRDLGSLLISWNVARPYDGGKRKGWC